jgi:hypothetical protein
MLNTNEAQIPSQLLFSGGIGEKRASLGDQQSVHSNCIARTLSAK